MNREQVRNTMKRRRGLEEGDVHHTALMEREFERNRLHRIDWDLHAYTIETTGMRMAAALEKANEPFWRRWFS